MNKANLQIGKKYLHIRKTVIDGVEREAERWIKCFDITEDSAYFDRHFERGIYLSNKEIEGELHES